MELLIRDGTYISNKQEERFVENLISDLEDFIEKHHEDNRASKEVFFLPPLPPRLRYLTHQTVQSVFYDRLTTKSVGEGEDRRTAIFVSEKKPNLASVTPESKKRQARLSSVAGMKEETKDLKKARKAEVAVYRPPHRRDVPASPTPILASEEKSECKIGESKDAVQKEEEKTTPKSRSKRPDVQVYVPKARRSIDPPPASTGREEKKPVTEPTPPKPQRRIGVCESPKFTSPVKAKQDSDERLKVEKLEACVTNSRTMEKAESEVKIGEVDKAKADSPIGKMAEFKSPLKRVASYQLAESEKNSNANGSVFRKSESAPDFKCRDLVNDSKLQCDQYLVLDSNGSLVSPPLRSPENGGKSPRKVSDKPRISRPRKTSFVPVEEQTSEPVFDKKPTRKPSMVYHGSELEQPSDVWRMEVSELYNGCADLTERHESSGYNSADSDKKDDKTLALVTDVAEDSVANQVFDSESRDFDSASSKGEDDSWDCIFNDDGEPIKHEVLEELTMAVGKNVTVNKPKIDYLSFVPSIDETQFDEELSHVVEFYDFSSTLKTEDLLIIFGGIRQSGGKSHFDIKWVDDTHALGIYSTPSAAVEALRLIHPLAKARSLAQASRESKLKARKTSEFLQPFKPRPATTASAARRLVTGALGLKSTQSPEQRKAEAQKLRDAKASKKMAAKQREDAWEGNFDSA